MRPSSPSEAPAPSRSRSSTDEKPESFQSPRGYDERLDHFARFFRAMREGGSIEEDAVFGYRAAGPALLCNDSYRQGKLIGWDPEAMRIVS